MVRSQSLSSKIVFWMLILVFCAFSIFPFIWMLSTSFKPSGEIFNYPPVWIPKAPTFAGYQNIWAKNDIYNVRFVQWIWNSLSVAGFTTFCSMIIASMGGYGMSRFWFRGRTLLGYIILITQMIPEALLLVPLYLVFKELGLLDNHWSLIIGYTTFAVPFSTWMMRGYFNTIPVELDESAMVDGAGRFGAFFRVVLPLTLPGLAATAIFSFILGWNEYLFASVFLNTYSNWTLPVALASFSGQYMIQWTHLMAGSVVVTLPVMIFFLFLQRYLVSGITAGAVKG